MSSPELLHQMELARQEGIPLTTAEFKSARVSADDNAAPFYHEAAALLKSFETESHKGWSYSPYSDASAANQAEAKALVGQLQPVLQILGKAAERPFCDFDLSLDLLNNDTSAFFSFRAFARLTRLEAWLKLSEGKPVLSLQSMTSTAAMCGHLAQSNSSTASLIQYAVEAIFMAAISEILTEHGRMDGVAKTAAETLSALGQPPDLAKIELARNIEELEMLSPARIAQLTDSSLETPDLVAYLRREFSPLDEELDEASDEWKQCLRLLRIAAIPGMGEAWQAVQIKATRELVAIIRSRGDDWIGMAGDVRSHLSRLAESEADQFAWAASIGSLCIGIGLSFIAAGISRRRVFQQAAAVFELWGKTGAIPSELPLRGLERHDPLANRDYVYTTWAGGFSIRGAGREGDDGGSTFSPGNRCFAAPYIGFKFPAEPFVE